MSGQWPPEWDDQEWDDQEEEFHEEADHQGSTVPPDGGEARLS